MKKGCDDKRREVPKSPIETDVIHTLMGRVATEEAKEALRIADEVSDMINFHRKVMNNGLVMTHYWEA